MINCDFENGSKASLRHAVVDTIVFKDGQVLLVKRSLSLTKEPGKWALPGGFVSRDERLIDAAGREVKEETGYDIEGLTLFYINDNPVMKGDDRQNIQFVFKAKPVVKGGDFDQEVSEIRWFSLEQLPVDQIAFNHAEFLRLYKKYLTENFSLPYTENI